MLSSYTAPIISAEGSGWVHECGWRPPFSALEGQCHQSLRLSTTRNCLSLRSQAKAPDRQLAYRVTVRRSDKGSDTVTIQCLTRYLTSDKDHVIRSKQASTCKQPIFQSNLLPKSGPLEGFMLWRVPRQRTNGDYHLASHLTRFPHASP
jgi:hypothetical protein